MADDKMQVVSLYDHSIEIVYQRYINSATRFNIHYLPDRIIHNLICQCLKNEGDDEKAKVLFKKMSSLTWIRLLKYEGYKKTVMRFYQKLINCDYPVGEKMIQSFKYSARSNDESSILKHIYYGLILGTFLSEASWYRESEDILTFTITLCDKLPEDNDTFYILQLECCHRLFRTLTMYFKFDCAEEIFSRIMSILSKLEKSEIRLNYALLFAEFSKYNFYKNNYENSYQWIRKAMYCLHDKVAVSTAIQVIQQAAKVCVVKRDFIKAKYLIHQALGRAEHHYGSGCYKIAGLFVDFGFYLLNADHIAQSVEIYQDAYNLRTDMFSCKKNNLHVAIVEEDLAYALYVKEYSTGDFGKAMTHAEQAIDTMKKLLPSGNLMLSSANRVKALILEEMALDPDTNPQEEEDDEINMETLKEAEKLHKDALRLTKDTFGEENILTAKHYGNLGRLYQSMKKYEEAERMHLKAIEIKEKILGADDYEVGLSVGHLASLYNYHMFKYQKAKELYYRSMNINLKLFSESYSGLEYDYRGLIHVYQSLGDDEQYLEFSSKYNKWKELRSKYASDAMGPNFYKDIKTDPIPSIVEKFDTPSKFSDNNNCKSSDK